MISDLATARPGEADAVAGQARARGRHHLGAELRQLRQARSLRLEDVAAELDLVPSTLSRMETGKGPVKTTHLIAMLSLYQVDDPRQRTRLQNLARDGRLPSWHDNCRDLLPAGASHYLDLETTCTSVRSYAVHAVPGLTQTDSYAAAAIAAAWPGLTSRQVRDLAALQVRRQELALAARRRLHLLLDESALLRPVGTAPVMAAQLRHLLILTTYPAITVQVAELAMPRPVLTCPFTILTVPGSSEPDVACHAGIRGQITITTRDADLRALHHAFTALTGAATSPGNTATLISNAAAHWEQQARHDH